MRAREARSVTGALPAAKIVNSAVLNGSSTVVTWSTIARAATAAANPIAGKQTGMSRRRAGREAVTSRAVQIAARAVAAVTANQRSQIPAARTSDRSQRIRKIF